MIDPTVGVSEIQLRVDQLQTLLRDVSDRLDRSERRHRRRFRLAVVGGCSAALLLMAGGAAYVQQFTRLDVIGPSNDIRVSTTVDPVSGSAGIEILSVEGRRVIFLGTTRDGLPNLSMYDPTGQKIVREVAP
ncbi:hypothetical protein P12x_005189 [Tundrisphaera lichenicola]|uniref:hypothetical protein n=1 Tax=Tundrisphaera lichenicola TaxID=2029860 RepID=UPI003EBC7156